VFAVTIDVWGHRPLASRHTGRDGGFANRRAETCAAKRTDNQSHGSGACGNGKLSTWLRFLEDATKNDAELTRFLQQWAGYSLTGITREHALVFVFGSGGNGKTVFINVLTGIVADYAASAAMETFAASHSDRHPTDLAMLRGARLVTASETEEGRAWAVL